MRIAYFTESLPPLTDGVSLTLSKLADWLQKLDVEFLFFSPFKPDTKFEWVEKVRQVFSVPFPLYREYRVCVPMFDNLYKELDQFKPDIIHVAAPTPLGIVGVNYAEEQRIPAVSSYHTHFISYFKYYGFHPLENLGWAYLRWFYNRCQTTYAPSVSAKNELMSRGIKLVEVWQRGVNVNNFSTAFRNDELRRSIGAKNVPILLFVGRLVKEKDLDDLIEADSLLKSWGNEYKLVIIGDGPMRSELSERLPDAYFTGYLRGKTLSEWYASSDIFVFPSTTETFGNVVIEAFASGLPVIGVREGGVSDIIDSGQNGFLAEANNPTDFAIKIRTILQNTALRKSMSLMAKKSARRYSWEMVNTALLNSYQKILTQYCSTN